MSPCRPVLLGLTLTLALAPAAPALIVEGDALANSVAPSPTDPGWNNVGKRSAYGAVYIGSGWVLTAGHVGAGDVYFGGVLYPWVPGSDYQLTNPDSSPADLVMFHLYPPYPALPALTIASTQPPTNRELILIGHGYTIGDPTSWDPFPGPPPSAIDGYNWAAGVGTRWGKNRVEISSYYELDLDSWVFASVFDEPSGGGITNECQGATGDSGGAVFGWNGSSYELAGILEAIGTFQDPNQPAQTALYGNTTFATDLSIYRTKIINQMPEPTGGLWPGAAIVAALARTRRRITAPRSPGSARTSDRAR